MKMCVCVLASASVPLLLGKAMEKEVGKNSINSDDEKVENTTFITIIPQMEFFSS